MNNRLQEQIDKLTALSGYKYKFMEFTSAHRMLLIRASDLDGNRPDMSITFAEVAYIQAPTSWRSGDFRHASKDEFQEIMDSPNAEQLFDAGFFQLFVAGTPDNPVKIIAALGEDGT